MKPFDYLLPSHLAEASDAWAAHGASARLLGGGTDLTVALRHGHLSTDLVIDLKSVAELKSDIGYDGDCLRVSAGTTMTALGRYLADHDLFPALQDATAVVGSIQIRNRATLAGNICNASPAADTVPVLAAMGAEVEIYGPGGTRMRSVDAFIEGNRKIDLGPGEIVTAVLIPLAEGPRGCAFDRITRRRGVDLATTNMACTMDANGAVTVAFGAVTPRPLVLHDDSGVLGDPASTHGARADAIARLAAHASPITDVRATAEYRTAMLGVMSERALSVARARLNGGMADA
ncbi:MAG: xanthine dehydrogenase family protein subunit M [Pseudomonadota bacterium]